MKDIHNYINKEVKIGEKEGEVTRVLGTSYLEVTFFNAIEGRIPVHISEIDKYLVSENNESYPEKVYDDEIMKAIRQRRGLDENDKSEDADIMQMAKQDVFDEYCSWNGLLDGYGYKLLNVIEDIYETNLQQ